MIQKNRSYIMLKILISLRLCITSVVKFLILNTLMTAIMYKYYIA